MNLRKKGSCSRTVQQRSPKSVKIDPWTRNGINYNQQMTYLEINDKFIWLDHPRRDFDPVGQHQYGSGGFFCSNWEYLAIPGTSLYVSDVIGEFNI